MHICEIIVEISVLIGIGFVVSHGVILVPIMRIIFMIPVKQSEIQSHSQPFSPYSLHKFLYKIPAALCIG